MVPAAGQRHRIIEAARPAHPGTCQVVVSSRPPRGKFRNVASHWRSSRLSRGLYVALVQFLRPHHVQRPRDRYRTITPLPLFGVLPEPVHATRPDAETSTIMHLARIPGKELPQKMPFNPVPVCPPAALADLHDAHSHPGFARRQHSAHVEILPVPRDAFVFQTVHALLRSSEQNRFISPSARARPGGAPEGRALKVFSLHLGENKFHEPSPYPTNNAKYGEDPDPGHRPA